MASISVSQTTSYAPSFGDKVDDQSTPSKSSPPKSSPTKTFLDLPKEIRLEIYDWVFSSTTLAAEDTESIPTNMDPDDDDSVYEPGEKAEIYSIPVMSEKLNLVCRLLNEEIGQSWHGKVTYWFPCTVAFIDVLSQWSQDRLEAVRHVHICAFPLPLYPIDNRSSYCTHFIHNALPIFPGLRLDLLTVENIWLEPDGEDLEGWGKGATYHEVRRLLESKGWKELHFLCGTLPFFSSELREIDEEVTSMKKARDEERFAYSITASRPRLCGLTSIDRNGNRTEEDTAEDKAEVAEWEAQHQEWAVPVEKAIQVWAKRGTEDYAHDGEGRTKWIEGLLEQFSWMELRKHGRRYLVDDGMDDASAHL